MATFHQCFRWTRCRQRAVNRHTRVRYPTRDDSVRPAPPGTTAESRKSGFTGNQIRSSNRASDQCDDVVILIARPPAYIRRGRAWRAALPSGLWLVHRGLRYARSKGSQGTARRAARLTTSFCTEFVATHESVPGPSRHFAWAQQSGRFWREADINRQAEPAGLVANDPTVWTGRATLL